MTLSLQEKFRAELNEKQFEAVCYDDGPSLVVAGAGSGKTRVLTYKIAWLIANGVEPWRILALTFTNKAAREMNGRIAAICDAKSANAVWSGTFHSLFSRILRIESEAVGIPRDFTIYDSSNTLSAIKKIVKDLGLDDKAYKASAIAGRISKAKNLLQLPADYAADKDNLDRDRRNGVANCGAFTRCIKTACAWPMHLISMTFCSLPTACSSKTKRCATNTESGFRVSL